MAQDYDVLPLDKKYVAPVIDTNLDEDSDQYRNAIKAKSNVERTIRNARSEAKDALDAGNINLVQEYLESVLFPMTTQLDDEMLSNAGTFRAQFKKDFLSASVPDQTRVGLLDNIVLPNLKKIVEGNYHPAARLNAITLVGELDSKDGDKAASALPVPHAASVKYLLECIAREDLPEYVTVGAASGLTRIALIAGAGGSIDNADSTTLRSYASSVLGGTANGQDKWSKDVGYWMQRRATQILGNLRSPGANGAIVESLNQLIADSEAPINLRADAVDAISKITVGNKDLLVETIDSTIAFSADALEYNAVAMYDRIKKYVGEGLLFHDKYLLDEGRLDGGKGGRQGPQTGTTGLEGSDTSSNNNKNEDEEFEGFDLPNFDVNIFRRQTRGYLVVSLNAIRNRSQEDAFKSDAQAVQRSADAQEIILRGLDATNMGLKNLREPDAKTGVEPGERLTDAMHDKFLELSSSLKELAPKAQPAAAAPADPNADS
ncbi:MAG: hypothetical protein R3C03_14320 [Pirellulaceae bacterium]